jgi:inverted formin-2
MADLNWDEMEGLFCQQQSTSAQVSPKLGGRESADYDRRPNSKRDNEITLLDGKRSLNVNIFLKQFRRWAKYYFISVLIAGIFKTMVSNFIFVESSNENIIQLIKEGEHDDIGAEKLKGLLKILPEKDELEMLKSFEGDTLRLGNAEKFLLQLLQVPE